MCVVAFINSHLVIIFCARLRYREAFPPGPIPSPHAFERVPRDSAIANFDRVVAAASPRYQALFEGGNIFRSPSRRKTRRIKGI